MDEGFVMKKEEKNKKKIFNEKTIISIAKLIMNMIIGFGIGSIVSIVGGVPFLLSVIIFTVVCGMFSAVETGLIVEMIIRIVPDNKSELEENDDWIKDIVMSKEKTMSQEKKDEIHSRGKLTPEDKVKEWESFDLCAPGSAIDGTKKIRCSYFNYDCHECLLNYAYKNDEYVAIDFKLTNGINNSESSLSEVKMNLDDYFKKLEQEEAQSEELKLEEDVQSKKVKTKTKKKK